MDSITPEISILVPIYNTEKYLRECLDSICAQTFSNFEALCINDGSTDSSKQIIEEFVDKDSRFKIIDKPNSGYGASMNRGLDEASGKYIAILESDDLYLPSALEVLHETAKTFNAQVVKGEFNLYWSSPNERREVAHELSIFPKGKILDPVDHPKLFCAKSSIWSSLYLSDFLKENKIRFLESPGASYQDTSFNFKVWATATKVVLIDDVILDYRQDNEQSSVNSPAKVYCVCDEYAEIERWASARPTTQRSSYIQGIIQRAKYDNYLWNYDRLSSDLAFDFLRRFSDEFAKAQSENKLDMDLFEPWAEADLLALIDSPRHFSECRDDVRAQGKLNTFKHYFRLGGFPLILKVLKYKKDNR